MLEELNKTNGGRLLLRHLWNCKECRDYFLQLDKEVNFPPGRYYTVVRHIVEQNHRNGIL